MKGLLLLLVAFTSISNATASTVKTIDFYQDSSCHEMINLESDDGFIRFAAKEIISDLGKDICDNVQSIDSLEGGEAPQPGEVSAVQFGKLIESLHNSYNSER